jgi:hypothetical protein
MQKGTSWSAAISETSSRRASHSRHLLIISRHHPTLYEYVRARFADEDNVEVVLDRRREYDRRARSHHPLAERRAADRRVHAHVDAALRMESMQFVTIAPSPAQPYSRSAANRSTTA